MCFYAIRATIATGMLARRVTVILWSAHSCANAELDNASRGWAPAMRGQRPAQSTTGRRVAPPRPAVSCRRRQQFAQAHDFVRRRGKGKRTRGEVAMSNKSKPHDDETRRITAIHEAAHSVILYRTTGASHGHTTIVPGEGSLGAAIASCSDSLSAHDMEGEILSCYAGGIAQRLHDSLTADDGCQKDDELASKYLAQTSWSLREQEFRDRADLLVRQHWVEICAVADELLRRPTLDATEVETLSDIAAGSQEVTVADLARYRLLRDGATD
jgi:hypothetical protein